ncbi:MAG: hypothetical protein IJT25_02105, partial [Clostridia bacterium]|nr:hypothetical protein [Clostridia bacterium]
LFIYSKFKGSHWQNYSIEKRLKILQALENKLAKKAHREPLPVIVHPDPNWNCFGMFQVQSGKRILFINENLLYKHELRYHALETIIHEGRHAYQYNVINSKISPLNFKAKAWKKNYEGYFSSNTDATIYSFQPIERDAQKFTIKMLKKLAYKYRNDEAFAQTLKANLYRYEQAELDAKKEYGLFYKHKINKKIESQKEHGWWH